MCSYCGVQWRRSQLRRDLSGNLVCPDEGNGKDSLELSMENAVGAKAWRYSDSEMDGVMDQDITPVTAAQNPTSKVAFVTFGNGAGK
jgi:hypothetical protein